jgi:hypothetical protein
LSVSHRISILRTDVFTKDKFRPQQLVSLFVLQNKSALDPLTFYESAKSSLRRDLMATAHPQSPAPTGAAPEDLMASGFLSLMEGPLDRATKVLADVRYTMAFGNVFGI